MAPNSLLENGKSQIYTRFLNNSYMLKNKVGLSPIRKIRTIVYTELDFSKKKEIATTVAMAALD